MSRPTSRPMRWPGRPAVALVLVALLGSACGSNLEPADARRAEGLTGSSALIGAPLAGAPQGGSTGTDAGLAPVGTDATGGTAGVATPARPVDDSQPGPDVGSGAEPEEGPGGETEGSDPARGADQPQAASCEGLAEKEGVTDTTITIGNVSDIAGPVPGLFQQTQDAVRAYVAYFNATSSICGRKLEVITYDSKTDASADQQAYARACAEVFATIGSASAFDSGGAATTAECGLPDLRANSLTEPRNACSTCFGANSTRADQFEDIVPETIKKDFGGGDKAAMLYLNAGAAAGSGKVQAEVGSRNGLDYVYTTPIDVAEFNYVPYVQAMKDKGVESIQFVANEGFFIRLVTTMEQQGFEPEVLMLDPTAYTDAFVEGAGDAGDGTIVFTNFTPFEEASGNPEMQLYLQWLAQINPSARPGFFGVFAWSAARLFSDLAIGLGGELDRSSLVDAVRGVKAWTGKGMHAPQEVGRKQVSGCWRFLRLQDGRWSPYGGRDYRCSGVTTI